MVDPLWDVFLPIGTPVPIAIAAADEERALVPLSSRRRAAGADRDRRGEACRRRGRRGAERQGASPRASRGKPEFEAWLFWGDSGTFFAAGTTKVIAQRVQMGIDISDKKKNSALADALGRLDASKGAIRKLADVRAATPAGLAGKESGRAAKAPVTKKPAAKKPANR